MAVRDITQGWRESLEPGANEILITIRSNEKPGSKARYEHYSVDRDAKPMDIVAELKELSTIFPSDVYQIELMLNSQVRAYIWQPLDAEQKLLEQLWSLVFAGVPSVVV